MRPNQLKEEAIYHVSGKCILNQWPDMPMEHVWIAFCNHISVIHEHFKQITPFAFVLMDNHFHLLCRDEDECLEEAIGYLKDACETTFTLVDYWDPLFAEDKLYIRKINSFAELVNCYKYIYQNPLLAGLCKKVEDYPFGTLYKQLGAPTCVVEDPLHLIFDTKRVLYWLNGKIENLYSHSPLN